VIAKLIIFFLLLYSFSLYAASNSYRSELPEDIYSEDVSTSFSSRVNNMLPERGRVSDEFLNNSEQAVFDILEPTDIYSTFLWEGAGYKNSFGYFKLDHNNQKIEEVEVVGNASMVNSGGGVNIGDTFLMGSFSPGDRIGFYIWGNGWNRQLNQKQKYYTYQPLNQDGIQHAVTAFDSIEQKVVIDRRPKNLQQEFQYQIMKRDCYRFLSVQRHILKSQYYFR